MIDYKKIIKSRATRAKILRALSFIPDNPMVRIQYFIKTGRILHLKHPKRYTEKLQWYKLYYRNPIMHQCVDKYAVRDFVRSRGLESILVKQYGYYKTIDEVDFDSLPNSFVIKTTHGGGGLKVVICADKTKFDINATIKKLAFTPGKVENKSSGREWAYLGINKGVVVEELLVNKQNPKAGINDYKIFCYNGKPKYIIVDTDRYIGHKRNFYDNQWRNLNVVSDCPAVDREIPKPKNFDKMLKVAARLSKGFPYVRVDLYNIEGKIYFGELTFYPWSGYVQFTPDKIDYEFGKFFELRKFS